MPFIPMEDFRMCCLPCKMPDYTVSVTTAGEAIMKFSRTGLVATVDLLKSGPWTGE